MDHEFDAAYWEDHWQRAGDVTAPPHPSLVAETAALVPGTALEAGCGEGAEAVWLASRGWRVTAADVSAVALARAARRTADVEWVQADLATWTPGRTFDLVTTHYAHPAMPQLDFYRRIADWVAPGGTLLVVGHLDGGGHGQSHGQGHGPGSVHGQGHGHPHGREDDGPPARASVTAASTAGVLDPARWDVVTAVEERRTTTGPGGHPRELWDVVVRATRRV